MKKLMILCGCFLIIILAAKPDRSSRLNSENIGCLHTNALTCTPTVSSDGENACLSYQYHDFYRYFWVDVSGCTPSSYQWYVNDVAVLGAQSNYILYPFYSEDGFNVNDEYEVKCIVDGVSDSISGYITDECRVRVSVTGDEDVWPDTYGNWSATVSGGSGEYAYGWYVNYHLKGGGADFEYFFDSNEWQGEQGIYITCVPVDLNGYEDQDTATVFVTFNDRRSKSFSVELSPNPASDYVNIDITKNKISDNGTSKGKILNNDNEALVIRLYDPSGKIIYQSKSSENRITIPVSGYFPGIYHLKVSSFMNSVDKKLIISR